jgi:hypothetical protein
MEATEPDNSLIARKETRVAKYRKKPVVIEAQLHEGPGTQAWIAMWCHGIPTPDGKVVISTLEGAMTCDVGDWVIQGVKGEFYPCKPDIFAATYEAVE